MPSRSRWLVGSSRKQQVGLRAPARARSRAAASSRRRAMRCAPLPSVNPARPSVWLTRAACSRSSRCSSGDGAGDHFGGALVPRGKRRPAGRSRRACSGASKRNPSPAPAGPRESSAAWIFPSRSVRSGPAVRRRRCRAKYFRRAAREPKDLEIPLQLSIRAIYPYRQDNVR